MSAQWDRLVESDGFQRLPPDERARVRNNYFEKVLAPRIPPEKLGTALKRWDSYRPEDKRNPKAVELMGDAGYAEAPTRSRLPVPLRADLLDDVQPGEIQNDAQGRQAVIKNGQAFPMSAGFDQSTAAPQTIARAQPEPAAPDVSEDVLRGAFGKASPDRERPASGNLATDAAMSLGARAAMLPADLAVGTADLAARGVRGGFRAYDALGIPGAGWVAEQIKPIKDQQALQDTYVRGRRAIQDAVSRNLSLETQEQQQVVSAAMDAAADGSGSLLDMVNQVWAGASAMTNNPRALAVTVAETVPDMFVAGGFARAAAAPLFKKTYDLHVRAGFNPRAAALIAAKRTAVKATGAVAGAEATIAANMSADEAAAAIDDVSDEELAAVSPRFASLMPQVGAVEARRMMKSSAMDTAAQLSAGITAVAGRLTGASSQIGKIATRGIVPETVARSVPSAVARGVGAQTGEEFIQEGGDAFAQNRAAIDSGADPERDSMRGVMAQAGAGAVAGAALGGPIGAAGNIGTGEPLKPEPTKPRMSLREYMDIRSGKKKAAPPVAPKAEPAKPVVVEGVTLTQQTDEDGTPYWTAPGVERAFTAPEEFAEWRADQNADAAVTAEIKTLLEKETPSGEISPAEVAAASNGQPGDQTLGGARAVPADEGRADGDGGADAGMPAPGMRTPAPLAQPRPEPAPALTTPPTGGVSRSKAPKPETAEDIEANERRYLMKMLRGTGIDIGERTDITREQPRTAARMAPGLFRKGGRTIDDVATDLYNAGFISETDFNDVDGGVQAARDLIYNAITKSEPVLSIEARDRWIALRNDEAMTAQDAADELGVDAVDALALTGRDLSGDNKPDVIDYALVEQANEVDEAAVEMAARQFENDDAAFMRAVQEIIDGRAEAARQADQVAASGAGREADARGSGQAVATGEPAASQTEVTQGPDTGAFSLAQQTEASRQKDEARVAQAEAQKQKQRQQAEMRAQSEREAGDFTLTGSDRQADVGTARGQGDIFAPRMDEGSKAETPVAATSAASESATSAPQVTQSDVSQARALLTSQVQARIDAMKGADVQAAARALERETGVKLPFGKAKAREAVADAVAQFPQATAERFGVPFDDDARRVFTAELEGRVVEGASGSGEQRAGISPPSTQSDAPPGPESAPRLESSPSANRLDDFGEKLGGARKDDAPSLSRELTDEDIASQPLSKIWPKTEIDAVEDKFIAALLTAAREEIPAKPRKGYKLKRWVATVQQMRGMAKAVQGVGREKVDALIAETPTLGNWFAKVRLLEKIERSQWPRIGGVVEAPEAYSYVDGERESQPAVLVEIDGKRSWFQGFGDVEGVVPRVVEKLAGDGPAKPKMQFNVYTRRSDGVVFITKKGDKEKRVLREFQTPKQAFTFISENYDELVSEWEGVKDRDNVRKSDVRRSENRPRTGADRRNGRDADEAMFTEAFGFRGVEFGNWLQQGTGQKDRQGMLNEVYDALMDLSDVVGVPPRAMSLGGTLGLGLGSRGKGGKAAAHFEPDTLVINLTKTKGAGSLAHEWFHALDNYFARKRVGGDGAQGANFITYKPEPLMVRKDRSRLFPPMTRGQLLAKRRALGDQTDNFNDDKWERDPSAPQGVRPEVEERFADLVEALNESPMAARARLLDSDKKAYWSQIIERGARSFENYVISKMMEKGYQNDFLANVVALEAFTRDKGRYPYLMPEEVAPVAQAFDALFETIETQQDGDNVVLFSRDGQSAADQTQTAEFKRWFGDSKVVDADGKPLVVYHGSPNAGFTVFDEDRAGSNTQNARAGFFFTESKKNAETYSGRSTEAKLRDDFDPDYDGEAGVYPVYLSIHDPLEVDFGGRNWDGALEGEYDGHESVPEIVDQAKAAGYDGVIIRNVTDEGRFGQGYHWGNETYVAFRPEQVKSATGNRGTFDPADPDISRLQSGTVPASNRPDAPEWDRGQVEKLNAILARQAGQDVPLRAVEPPRAMRGLSETMETLLGRKAVFFESSDTRAPAGVYVSGGVLFVNADAKQPLRHVLGHEFTHSLEGPAAELHAILKARILEMAKEGAFPAYEARLEKVYQRDGLPALSRAKVENEFVADVMGSIMSDPKVLFDLKQRMEPNAFKRLMNRLRFWIEKMMSRLRREDMRQSQFAQRTMRDLQSVKTLVADVLQATAEGQLRPAMRDAAMSGQPLFARQAEPDSLTRAKMLTSMTPISVETPASLGEAAADYRQVVGRSVKTADGNQVQIVNRALRKMRSHSADPRMRAVIGSVGELLPAARLLWSQPVRSKPDDSTAAFHHFGVRARISGEPVFVRYVVRENVNGDMLYDGDAIIEAQKIPEASQLTAPMAAPRSPEDSQSIAQWLESVNAGRIGTSEQARAKVSNERAGQDADGVRDRIVAARNEAGERRNPTDDRPRQGESDVTQNPPDGGFSDSGADVKFSRQDQTSTDPDDISTLLPPNWGGWGIWHRKVRADNRRALNHNLYPWFINRFSEVERAVKFLKGKGVAIPDERDPGSLEKTFYGRTQTRLDDLKDTTKALFKVMNKAGVSFKQASDYLYALHAQERNAAIAERNSMFPDGGSGMTNRQAKKILAEVAALPQEQRDALAEVSRVVQAINRQKLNLMREAGLISAQQYQDLTTGYQHYVPLKSVVDPEEQGQGTGNGFDQRSTVIREAFGRASRAEDPLAVALLDAQKTFVRAEKNRVGRAVYNLILETSGNEGLISGPAGDYWRVMTPAEYPKMARTVKVPVVDPKTGKPQMDGKGRMVTKDDVQYVPSINDLYRRDEIFMARVDGALVVMEFQNKRLAKQLKNMAGEQLSWVLKGIGAATRLFGRTLTMYNPEFALPNFVRDVQTAFLNAFGADMKDPKGFAFDVMKNLRAGLVGAVRGKDKGWVIEGSPLYREFLESGGTTGAYGLTGVDDIKAEFQRLVDQQRKGVPNIAVQGVKGGVSGFFNMLERYNEIFENTTRLAIYKAARDRGLSKQESARLAKDTTVNFNQKGELQWPSAFYVFFNAAMQGNFAMLKAAARSKWTRRAMLGLMVAGLVESLLEGDDEEGEPLGDAAGKWSLGRELTAFIDEDTFIKWPIAYGYNVPYAMGRMVGRAVRGNASPAEAVGVSLSAFMTSFMPTDTLIPSVAEPFLNVANNETSFGSTIYRRSFGDDTYDPVAYRDYEEKALTGLMQTLHGMMGGTRFGPNWVKEAWNVDPLSASGAEALVKGYVGPQWRLVEGMVTVLAGDGPTHRNDVPVVRRFVNERSEYFYDSRFSDIARQADAALKTIKSMEDSDEPYADQFTKKQEDAIDEVLWIAKEDRKARRDIEDAPDDATKAKWEAERDAEVRAGIRIWNDAFGR